MDESIVIGDKGGEIPAIINALKESPCFGTLHSNLSSLRIAMDLDDTDGTWAQMQIGLTIGMVKADAALFKILSDWRLRSPQDATLGNLASILERNDMADFANKLRAGFKPKSTKMSGNKEDNSDFDSIGADEQVYLDFGAANIKYQVLMKIQADLANSLLANTGVNKNVIVQLASLEIFDQPEIRPLMGEFRTEQDRILALVQLLSNREPPEIKLCLEKLCNLEGNLFNKKKEFRKYFHKHYPGSVKRCV